MKTLLLATILFTIFLLPKTLAQELVSTKYEKGYMKDGKKISVWEYYNYPPKYDGLDKDKLELELKINHNNGKVYYLRPDTTDYVIFYNGRWISTKLQFYPIPEIGHFNFLNRMIPGLNYLWEASPEGEVIIMFEVDTMGVANNFQILKDIGDNSGEQLVHAVKERGGYWIPARVGDNLYKSRFIISMFHTMGTNPTWAPDSVLPLARRITIELRHGFSPPTKLPSRFYSLTKAVKAGRRVRQLSLVDQQLNSFPKDIFKFDNLTLLDLERNFLTELPAQISTLQKLEELYLPWNRFKQLPESIGKLNHLTHLSIAANEFTKFPDRICDLVRLKALDLADNKIDKIPPCIANLKDLEIISLANNNLTRLPDEFFQLKKLKVIYLNDNNFNQATINRVNTTFKKARIVWTSKEQPKK